MPVRFVCLDYCTHAGRFHQHVIPWKVPMQSQFLRNHLKSGCGAFQSTFQVENLPGQSFDGGKMKPDLLLISITTETNLCYNSELLISLCKM